MPRTSSRFPRTSYANRAAVLAQELAEWVPWLREYADGPTAYLQPSARRDRARARAYALEDLAAQLQDIAVELLAVR